MSLEYAVGYGKPPLHGRFRPGRSGNPRGRPKGALGLKATAAKVLRQTVTVREGELVRRVTRLEAVLLSLIARALKGDAKAIATVLELSRLVEQEDTVPEPVAESDSAKRELASRLDRIAARLAAARTEDGTDVADPGSAGPGSAGPGSADPGSADPGSADPGSAGGYAEARARAPDGQARDDAETAGSTPHGQAVNTTPHGRAEQAYAGARARDTELTGPACYRRPGPVGARAGPTVTELA